MSRELDKADIWLIDEIEKELQDSYHLSKKEVYMYLKNSNLMPLLLAMPEQVHHETPKAWARTIARQNKLKVKKHD